ncbi:MAG: laccase domain-containing protein, partial [Lysobacterales bacterium]
SHTAFAKCDDRWLLDLYTVARQRLERVGVNAIYGGGYCTFSEPQRFYSFRRDGVTGRMASMVWLEPWAS